MNPLAMQTARGAGPTKECRELSAFANSKNALNEELTHASHTAVSLLVGCADVDILGEELVTELRDRIHAASVLRQQAVVSEQRAPLLYVGTTVFQIGRFSIDSVSDGLGREVSVIPDSLEYPLVGLRHPVGRLPHHQKQWLEKHNTADTQHENWLSSPYQILSQVLYWFRIDAYGNDCRNVSGRGKVGMESAPVKERFAVVQSPGMRPNDRTRTNAPGMDNCIGHESPDGDADWYNCTCGAKYRSANAAGMCCRVSGGVVQ